MLELGEVVDVDAAEREQDVGRHADVVELGDGAQHREVGVVVGLAPELHRVGEQAHSAQALYEVGVDARLLGELGERVAAITGREEAFEAGPVDVDDGADRGEGETLALELADPVEALEMIGAVEAVPALLGRRGEEALPGVVADGVDREPGLLGQLVDPPAGLFHPGSSIAA